MYATFFYLNMFNYDVKYNVRMSHGKSSIPAHRLRSLPMRALIKCVINENGISNELYMTEG